MEVHLVLLSHSMGLILRYDSLIVQVDLVAHDDHRRVLVLHLVNALHPVRNRLERLLVRQVKGQDYTVRLTVKLICYVLKLFLASGVPYFDLNFAIIFLVEVFGQNVVDGDRFQVLADEVALVYAPQNRRFTDGGIAEHD